MRQWNKHKVLTRATTSDLWPGSTFTSRLVREGTPVSVRLLPDAKPTRYTPSLYVSYNMSSQRIRWHIVTIIHTSDRQTDRQTDRPHDWWAPVRCESVISAMSISSNVFFDKSSLSMNWVMNKFLRQTVTHTHTQTVTGRQADTDIHRRAQTQQLCGVGSILGNEYRRECLWSTFICCWKKDNEEEICNDVK